MSISIYKAERDAGLTDQMLAQASVTFAAELRSVTDEKEKFAISKSMQKEPVLIEGSITTIEDLHPIKGILVTTGWNSNADIFEQGEVWAARHTPTNKPLNLQHNPRNIRGHITANYAMNVKNEVLADTLAVDELPDKYHLVTSAVIYKFIKSKDEALTKETEELIEEIQAGKWYLSMEALFNNFDYGVLSAKGEASIIQRNKDSAFLTQHLRQYGGAGEYEGYTLGRVLRNITFTGKGIVKVPANNESVIFKEVASFIPATKNKQFFVNAGYSNMSVNSQETKKMAGELLDTRSDLLDKEVRRLEETVKATAAKNAELEKRLADNNEKQVQATIAALQADVKSRDDKITSLAAQVQAEQDARKTSENKNNELAEANKKLQAEVDTAKAENVKNSRVAAWVEHTGTDKSVADKVVASLAKLNDEEFKNFLETQPKKAAPQATAADKKAGNTPDPKALETAQPDKKEPDLQTAGVNDSEQTRIALSDFLGKSFLRKGKQPAPAEVN